MTNVTRSVARTLPLLTAALLAACGGGHGSSVTPAAPNAGSAAKARGTITLTVKIPHLAASSTSRHSTYVSASTQSLAITITQGSTATLQEAVGLTTTSNPNCSTSGNTTTCTIALGLAAGSYTGTFATYDGPVVNNATTGNVLSQGQSIPLTVTASQTNTLAVTLDGVPASITIAPATGSTITGTQSDGFSVPYTAQAMTVEALDVDGNVILGSGAPTFTVSAPSQQFSVTQPTQGSPNTVMVAATGGGSGTLSITAAAPDGGFSCSTSGVVCTAAATIATGPHTLYVSQGSSATVYQSMDNVTWTQTATLNYDFCFFIGPYFPAAIAADANGDVAVSSFFGGCLDEFTPPYSNGLTSVGSPVFPFGVAFTPSRQLLDVDSTSMYVFAPPFTGSPVASVAIPGTSNLVVPYGVVLDSGNDAIVSTQGGDGTYLIASPYTAITKTLNTSNDTGALAIGPDNTVFIGLTTGQVLVDAPPYTSTPIAFTVSGGAQALAVTPSGNLWVVGANGLSEFTKPFSPTSTPTLTQANSFGGISLTEIASDSYGDLIVPTSNSTVSIINSSGTTIGTVTANVSSAQQVFYVR